VVRWVGGEVASVWNETTPSDWIELLDELDEFLDGQADAEGNSAADWVPNKAMRLLNRLREARAYREARGIQ
jgi:hypothetical protein